MNLSYTAAGYVRSSLKSDSPFTSGCYVKIADVNNIPDANKQVAG